MSTPAASGAGPLIRLTKVSRVYQADTVETHALHDVDLTVLPGEYVSISGPSGCGKSTLLSILGLLDMPSAGEYILAGVPVVGLTASERARVRNKQIGFNRLHLPGVQPDG